MDCNVLKKNIRGEVYDDEIRRSLHSADGSIFQITPACVVYPACADDVPHVVRFARENELSIHARGAGSGLCGSALGAGIVLDFTKFMNRMTSLDTVGRTFECEPGFRLGELEVALKGTGLFFPPDPSSGEFATFGGVYGTNASGAHSVKYGNVADYIEDAEVVFADGSKKMLSEISNTPSGSLPENLEALFQLRTDNAEAIEAAYPDILCNTAGYNLRGMVRNGGLDLRRLLAGSEGTLGIAVRLKFRLLKKPPHDSLIVAFMDSVSTAAGAVREILPMRPSGIEIMDSSLLELARKHDEQLRSSIPDGVDNVLLIEFDAMEKEECANLTGNVEKLLKKGYTEKVWTAVSPDEKKRFWAVRKAAVPILYKLKGEKKVLALIEDAAVPTDRLEDYFKGIQEILNRNGTGHVLYGHISRGLLHARPMLNLKDPADIKKLRVIADEVFDLIHSLGGTVSGEHGDGRLRSAYIKRKYPEIYDLFIKTKRLLDPENMLNPDIITVHDPDQMKKNLRYGADYKSRDIGRAVLEWPEGCIAEIEKCHGCSKCTTVTTATRMCPIFKFTRDETAAPKAKANLMRTLFSGGFGESDFYLPAFQSVLETCVKCGTCFAECPSGVNIPKIVMEARARCIEKSGLPFTERMLADAETAGRILSIISGILKPAAKNRMLTGFQKIILARPERGRRIWHTPTTDNTAKIFFWKAVRRFGEKLAGISSKRDIPLSPGTLFERIPSLSGNGDKSAVYFAGCHAMYFRPSVGAAAVEVLKRLNFTVHFPPQNCCGLPLLSKGMAGTARKKMRSNLEKWGHLLREADHVVVTCSSCGHALSEKWSYLADDPEIGTVKEKIIHISRLVNQNADLLKLSAIPAKLAYHAPCHLRIQPDPESSIRMLADLPGVEVADAAGHCCGMAGSWGMAAKNYDLSETIGMDLIAKIDGTGAETAVTDCPTCMMQIGQFWEKPVMHPMEILAERL